MVSCTRSAVRLELGTGEQKGEPDCIAWMHRLMLKPHLNHGERVIVTAFLYQNGISKDQIREFNATKCVFVAV